MDFYDKAGKMALGSRLRRLSETLTEDAAQVYQLYGTGLQPKWFPVFYSLMVHGELPVMEIAREIGHSHPSVIKIAREMGQSGLIEEKKATRDGRKNLLSLSAKGRETAAQLELQCQDVGTAVEEALRETRHDLWKAIQEWEYLLAGKSLLRRVQEQKKLREAGKVEIVDYQPAHHPAFRDLNTAWISEHFKMEAADHKALDHPQEYILGGGGHICMALYEGRPVGTCALIRMDEHTYELAKMAVAPEAQGKSIGWLLGRAVIEKAKQLGAQRIYLESNTKLTPAIRLYEKLGFKKIIGQASPYERCNIQMELLLN